MFCRYGNQSPRVPGTEGAQAVPLHGSLSLLNDGRAEVVELDAEALEVRDERRWIEGSRLRVHRGTRHLEADEAPRSGTSTRARHRREARCKTWQRAREGV